MVFWLCQNRNVLVSLGTNLSTTYSSQMVGEVVVLHFDLVEWNAFAQFGFVVVVLLHRFFASYFEQ